MIQRQLARSTKPKGAVLEKRPPPSKPRDLLVRLEVERLTVQSHRCVVTIFNAGNTASFSARINIYRRPLLHSFKSPLAALTLAGTATTSVGALERIDVTVATGLPNPFLSTHYAVAFDPLEDPFPVDRIDEMNWVERDLLHHDVLVWRQFAHRDSASYFGTTGLVEVPEERRSWTLRPLADHLGNVPENPRVRQIYFPGTPPSMSSTRTGTRSELRQDIYLGDLPDGALAIEEAGKGNVTATASCELFNFAQTPRDRGALAVGLALADGGSPSAVAQQPDRPDGQPYSEWAAVGASAGGAGRFNQVSVRLLAERRSGSNSDSYFGSVRCELKHRQVKHTSPQLLERVLQRLEP